MKIKKFNFLFAVSFILLLGYFMISSKESFLISLIITPIAGLFLYISFKTNNVTLSIFSIFFLISQGIDPPIFYMNKLSYDSQGWSAIGNFDFKLSTFFEIYANVYLLMCIIILFSIIFYSIIPLAINNIRKNDISSYFLKYNNINNINANKYSLFLFIFIIILIPLNLYMYVNKIGITGIVSPYLPFRFTGILFYFRLYFIPIVIFYLFMKSSRSFSISIFVFLYASISGLSSVSKSVFILSSIPILFFAVLNNDIKSIIVYTLLIIIFVQVVQLSRNAVYVLDTINISDYGRNIDIISIVSKPLYNHIQMISGSLFGAQGVILAHQHALADQFLAIFNFFSLRPIMEDMAYELYGLDFGEGINFGVGIGLFGSLVLLANKNIAMLIILGLIVSMFLFACECITRYFMSKNDIYSFLALPIAFYLVFNLYVADMKKLYIFIIISLFLIILSRTTVYKLINIKINMIRIYKKRTKKG